MRRLFAIVIVVVGCGGSIDLPEPAMGPPDADSPHPPSRSLVIEGDRAVDSQEITGECVRLYLWSQTGDGADWLLVAQNTELLTADGRNARGLEVICNLGGLPGPRTYELPMGDVPTGWYLVCNLSQQCSEPFEKP